MIANKRRMDCCGRVIHRFEVINWNSAG
jgi:hypothetical protein